MNAPSAVGTLFGVALTLAALVACGSAEPAANEAGASESPNLQGILFSAMDRGEPKLFITDAQGNALAASDAPGAQYAPDWSPDGQMIAYIGDQFDPGNPDLYIMKADGSGVHRVVRSAEIEGDPSWSADGRTIFFWRSSEDGTWLIQSVDVGSGAVQELQGTRNGDTEIDASPSGDVLSVVRNTGGDVSIEPLALTDAKPSVETIPGGTSPTWSPSGLSLAYTDSAGALHVTDTASGQTTTLQLPDAVSRVDTVEWGPTEDTLVFQAAATDETGAEIVRSVYVISIATREVTVVATNNQHQNYFGGLSWD